MCARPQEQEPWSTRTHTYHGKCLNLHASNILSTARDAEFGVFELSHLIAATAALSSYPRAVAALPPRREPQQLEFLIEVPRHQWSVKQLGSASMQDPLQSTAKRQLRGRNSSTSEALLQQDVWTLSTTASQELWGRVNA